MEDVAHSYGYVFTCVPLTVAATADSGLIFLQQPLLPKTSSCLFSRPLLTVIRKSIGWPWFLRAGGHQFSRLVAACSPGGAGVRWPAGSPPCRQGPRRGVRVAYGQDQVAWCSTPVVDGRGGEGLGHDRVRS